MILNNYNKWILSSVTVLALSACGGSSNSSDESNGTTNTQPEQPNNQTTMIHNGTVYGTVVSPTTGRVWLDRNLGASRVCTSYSDAQCFGDYYQWGRGYDGHQDPHSETTSIQITDRTNPHHMFVADGFVGYWFNDGLSLKILKDSVQPSYRYTPESDALQVEKDKVVETFSQFLETTDGSGICPVGFYVASGADFVKEEEGLKSSTNKSRRFFENFLKLPSAGFRDGWSGTIYRDSNGYHCSRGHFYFDTDHGNEDISPGTKGVGYGTGGAQIRCVKGR